MCVCVGGGGGGGGSEAGLAIVSFRPLMNANSAQAG